MKRIAVLGRGTAGAFNALKMAVSLRRNKIDSEVQWIYDPSIPTQAVGEGTNMIPVTFLKNYLNTSHLFLDEVDGTFKSGIQKDGWGESGKQFFHAFRPPNIAYHINALKTQDFIYNKLKNFPNVSFIEQNITSNKIDADYIIDCSGRPDNYDDFIISDSIPVNSVYVTQCYWDHPTFQYSLTNAAKHGWYFGIPLKNRCSIGYLYNNNLNTLDEIKEDVKTVFAKYGLQPSDHTNAFSFKSYFRKRNFVDNVCYNGNASFFLEPLEATTIGQVISISHTAFDVFLGRLTHEQANKKYKDDMFAISDMIMMHYFAGSKYQSKFWDQAIEKAEIHILNSLMNNNAFRSRMKFCLDRNIDDFFPYDSNEPLTTPSEISQEYGSWPITSFKTNMIGLGVEDKMRNLLIGID